MIYFETCANETPPCQYCVGRAPRQRHKAACRHPLLGPSVKEKDSSRSISEMVNHAVGKSYLVTLSHMLSGTPICGATLRFFRLWTEAVPTELIENAEKVA